MSRGALTEGLAQYRRFAGCHAPEGGCNAGAHADQTERVAGPGGRLP